MHSTLISSATLAQHLDDPDWVILDCQHDLMQPALGRAEYVRGHIPGAQFVSIDHDLAGAKSGGNGRHPLPSPVALEALFCHLGIGAASQVVVYDGTQGNYAGRAWWSLRWLGHDAVAVLDGGLTTWMAAGCATTTTVPPPHPTRFVSRVRTDVQRDAAYIAANLDANLAGASMKIIDARVGERYTGAQEAVDPVAGHIPGALNRFWKDNLAADGRFKSAAELRAEFDKLLGGTAAVRVIHQCGSGVSACHNLIAMEIAGLPGARLYPGSWSEWCANPARPVATGPTP